MDEIVRFIYDCNWENVHVCEPLVFIKQKYSLLIIFPVALFYIE